MPVHHAEDETWRDVYLDVASILARQLSFEAIAPQVLRTLADALGWDAAVVWLKDRDDQDRLAGNISWARLPLDTSLVTGLSTTLAIQVHATGQPQWTDELAEAARFHGLRCTGAFAILSGREVVGALQWFASNSARPDRAQLAFMLHVGTLLGQFIDSRRFLRDAEEARRLTSLGRLAATMAHEFGNVLMGIASFAEYLRRNVTSTAAEAAVGQIQRSLKRGRSLTEDLLGFTRTAEPVLEDIDVTSWLELFLPDAVALAGDRVRLQMDDAPVIRADARQLHQALINLVLNARDASPSDSIITISARATEAGAGEGECLELAVIDRGTGIPPDVLERIFEPLFTTKPSGNGIGLAVVHRMVRVHHGTIRVKSEVGVGTEFRIMLPAVRTVQATQESVARTLPRVLLVDDEELVALGIAELLKTQDVSVRVVSCGADAIPALHDDLPDALILDIGLPDVPATELYPRIAARWPNLPVVFISGHFQPEELEPWLVQPHIAFVRKPFELDELLEALEQVAPGLI
ncbi:MAG TPA: ATP-binding protein [Thermoanaerobaculia bacterium]|jgi:signal transduction histidine kinase